MFGKRNILLYLMLCILRLAAGNVLRSLYFHKSRRMSSPGAKDVNMTEGHWSSSKCLVTAAVAYLHVSEVQLVRCVSTIRGHNIVETWKCVPSKRKSRVKSDKLVPATEKFRYLIIHQSGNSTVEFLSPDTENPNGVRDYRAFGVINFCAFCPFGNPVKLVFKDNTIVSVPLPGFSGTPEKYVLTGERDPIRCLQCDGQSNLVFISTFGGIYKGTWGENTWTNLTITTQRNIQYLTLNTHQRLLYWCERDRSTNTEDNIIFKMDYNGEGKTRLGSRHSIHGFSVDDAGTHLFTCSNGPRVYDLQGSSREWSIFPGYSQRCFDLATDDSFAYILTSGHVTIYDVKLMSKVISISLRNKGLTYGNIEIGYHLN